jgi:phosphomethylpyrimidine synthase
MKITQEVRDFAAAEGIAEGDALEAGLERKSEEFRREGAEIYRKL